jgi:Flp pilus assembly pilin Flp
LREKDKAMRARAAMHRLLNADEGQDLVEYGILASLIAIAAMTALTTVGGRVATIWDSLKDFF